MNLGFLALIFKGQVEEKEFLMPSNKSISWHPLIDIRSHFQVKGFCLYLLPTLLKPACPKDQPALPTPVQPLCFLAGDILQSACPLFITGFWFSPLGYAGADMPVKAKRSTYNYSLPITVKKQGMLGQEGCLALLLLCLPHPSHRR